MSYYSLEKAEAEIEQLRQIDADFIAAFAQADEDAKTASYREQFDDVER